MFLSKIKCSFGHHNNITEGDGMTAALKCLDCGVYDNGESIKTAQHKNSYILVNSRSVRVVVTNKDAYWKDLKETAEAIQKEHGFDVD